MKNNILIIFSIIVFSVSSCKKDIKVVNPPATKECKTTDTKLFTYDSLMNFQLMTYTQKSNCEKGDFEFLTHGYWTSDWQTTDSTDVLPIIETFSISKKGSDTLIVTIPNKEGDGIGYLYASTRAGHKFPTMFEFEKITDNSFYVYQYEMNWNDYSANLLKRVIITKNADETWSENILAGKTNEVKNFEEVFNSTSINTIYSTTGFSATLFSFFSNPLVQTTIGVAILTSPGLNIATFAIGAAFQLAGNLGMLDYANSFAYDKIQDFKNNALSNLSSFTSNVAYNAVSYIHEVSAPSTHTNFQAGLNTLTVSDYSEADGDIIRLEVNDEVVADNYVLTMLNQNFTVNLLAGRNKISVITLSTGTKGACSPELRIGSLQKYIKGYVGVSNSTFIYAQ
jgi:hypothetical protein